MPVVLKSGSLNLLEHSGSVQAWNGTALPALLFTGPYVKDKQIEKNKLKKSEKEHR